MTRAPRGWRDDDELLAELGVAVREGQVVPDRLVRVGKAAFAWRTVDAELAELHADSWTDPAEPAGMRAERPSGSGRSSPRLVSFVASVLTIEVQVSADAIRGQLVPPGPGVVRIRDAAGAVREFPVDDVGWFAITPTPTGPIRLHVRTEAGVAVLTDWFSR